MNPVSPYPKKFETLREIGVYSRVPSVDANNNNLVEVYSCFGAEWQNWDRVGDTIVNAANGECLDIEGSNAVVRGCDGSDSQNWDMALP